MTQPFYEAQTDVAVGSRGKSSDINNLDSAVEQAFKNVHAYGVDSGTSSAYAITMDTDATAYYDGMVVMFAPDNTCAAAATVNVNGLGAKSIYNANHSSGIVQAGDIKTSAIATMVYNAAQGGFYLQGGPTGPSHGTASAAATNTAYGDNAVNSLSSGANNTGIGYDAGTAISSGSFNTAVGSGALAAVATTDGNTAVGYQAGLVVTGTGNTCFGSAAAKTYTGNGITAFGYEAAKLATGTQITAIGYNALVANTTGSANVAVGYNALSSCVDGGFNVAVGRNALIGAVDGALNVAVGDGASVDLASGTHNVAVGALSGINVTTASNSTYVGYSAYGGNHANSTGIGYNARVTADNQVVIGNSSVTETILRGQVKGGAGTGTGQPVMVGTLSVNTTPVGNVGAGTDDLMTYALPADSLSANGKSVRVTAWGTSANNVNAKTLALVFGSSTLGSISLSTSNACRWRVVAEIVRTGSNAQTYNVSITNGLSTSSLLGFVNQCSDITETDSSSITIKCTGAATSDNDVVQKGMIVEFLN